MRTEKELKLFKYITDFVIIKGVFIGFPQDDEKPVYVGIYPYD